MVARVLGWREMVKDGKRYFNSTIICGFGILVIFDKYFCYFL